MNTPRVSPGHGNAVLEKDLWAGRTALFFVAKGNLEWGGQPDVLSQGRGSGQSPKRALRERRERRMGNHRRTLGERSEAVATGSGEEGKSPVRESEGKKQLVKREGKVPENCRGHKPAPAAGCLRGGESRIITGRKEKKNTTERMEKKGKKKKKSSL